MSKEIIAILVLLLFSSFAYAQEESITITTYYPSPYGSYRELSTQRLKVGRTYPTIAVADDDLIVEGRVGIGTTNPEARLHVAGNIKIADGTQGQGKVLTSDASGLASWQDQAISKGLYGWCASAGSWCDDREPAFCTNMPMSCACRPGYERVMTGTLAAGVIYYSCYKL